MKKRAEHFAGKVVRVVNGENASAFAVVARHARPMILIYVFVRTEDALDIASLRAWDADAVFRTHDIAIKDGEWPIATDVPGFRKDDWPLVRFSWQDHWGRYFARTLSERDLLSTVAIERISEQDAQQLPDASLPGVGAVEYMLRRHFPVLGKADPPDDAMPVGDSADAAVEVGIDFPNAHAARAGAGALQALAVRIQDDAGEGEDDPQAHAVIIAAPVSIVEPFGDVERFERAIEELVTPFGGSIAWIETQV